MIVFQDDFQDGRQHLQHFDPINLCEHFGSPSWAGETSPRLCRFNTGRQSRRKKVRAVRSVGRIDRFWRCAFLWFGQIPDIKKGHLRDKRSTEGLLFLRTYATIEGPLSFQLLVFTFGKRLHGLIDVEHWVVGMGPLGNRLR